MQYLKIRPRNWSVSSDSKYAMNSVPNMSLASDSLESNTNSNKSNQPITLADMQCPNGKLQQYDAFILYADADAEFAKRVTDFAESHRFKVK